MAINTKIKTYSMHPDVLDKLEKLTHLKHITNRSAILELLIVNEYRRLTQLREEQ